MSERSYRSWLPQLSTWSVLTCLVLHQPEVILPLCVTRREVEEGGGGGRCRREVEEGGEEVKSWGREEVER